MSFGFSFGDFLAAIQLANKIRKDFVDAPSQFKIISDEVRNLSIVLLDTDAAFPNQELTENQKKDLEDIDKGCKNALDHLQRIIDKNSELLSGSEGAGKKVKRAWKRFKWKPEDINELRSRIQTNIGFLNAFNGRLIRENVAKLVQQQENQEWRAILDWLTPINFVSQQHDFITRRQEGTGRWLLESAEFNTWVETDKQILFCPGIPGAGKTIIFSMVVKEVTNRFSNDKSVGLGYLYCDFRRQDEQKIDNLLASLLKQLSQGSSSPLDTVKSLYDDHKNKRTRPSFGEILRALQSVAASYSRVFILVDALDEISFDDRDRFLAAMASLQDAEQAHINIFATSRPELTSHFAEHFGKHISKELRASDNDLITYVSGRLSTLRRPRISKHPDLQDAIRTEVVEAADGMFLHAKLYLDYLFSKPTPGDIEDALKDPPRGISGIATLYNQAMERINSQDEGPRKNANKVLSWIIHAKRPLKTTELQYAIAVRDGTVEFMPKYLPEVEDLVSDCAGLVTIDVKNDIVRLVHYTTQDYFDQTRGKWFPNAEIDITATCITYLSLDEFESGICVDNEAFERRLQANKLYDYAACNWGHHARIVSKLYQNSILNQTIVNFLKNKPKVEASSQPLLNHRKALVLLHNSPDFPEYMTGLHLAAYFGLERPFHALCNDDYGPQMRDYNGWTPLSWAAEMGHTVIIKYLLVTGKVDVNFRETKHARTPILLAASNGHLDAVKLLIEEGAELESKDTEFESTPLLWAAWRGHEEVVKILLENGAKLECRNFFNSTPLSLATESGHLAVVELLLKHGADPNTEDNDHRTPLSYATEIGQEAISRLLLKTKGAHTDIKAARGCTQLLYAAKAGFVAILKSLLRVTINIDSKYTFGRTLISWASEKGREGTTNILLAPRVEINSNNGGKDTELQTIQKQQQKGKETWDRLVSIKDRRKRLSPCDKDRPFHIFAMMKRDWIFLSFPVVACASFSYIIHPNVSLILAYIPYNFAASIVGLSFVSPIISAAIGSIWTGFIGARVMLAIRRKGLQGKGLRMKEDRLWMRLSFETLPSALVLWGVRASHGIHWFGLVFALGCILYVDDLGIGLSISYCTNSYKGLSSGALVCVILIRYSMSFAINYGITDWIDSMGTQNAFIMAACVAVTQISTFLIVVKFWKWWRERRKARYYKYVQELKELGIGH